MEALLVNVVKTCSLTLPLNRKGKAAGDFMVLFHSAGPFILAHGVESGIILKFVDEFVDSYAFSFLFKSALEAIFVFRITIQG